MTEVTTTNSKVTFSPEQLEIALLGDPVAGVEGVYDLFDRCILDTQLIVLKETAKAVKNNELLYGDGIDVGISWRNMSKEACNTLRDYAGVEDATKDFEIEINGVPVRVKIFERDYNWFKNPDPVTYQNCMVMLPNPFENYYKARQIIH